jgi:hypothetical protein
MDICGYKTIKITKVIQHSLTCAHQREQRGHNGGHKIENERGQF